ncbi:hypothetical protein [Nocardia sp. NPDC052566]|uniref:hypothetical protein n=1 Tax=Nocardia sp. NPDC052566 TaxID=3364330 RepID=UPI0037C78716
MAAVAARRRLISFASLGFITLPRVFSGGFMLSMQDPGRFLTTVITSTPQPLWQCVLAVGLRVSQCWPDTYVRGERALIEDLYLTGADLGLATVCLAAPASCPTA